jgi:ABC-type uncharacterized transport system
MKSIASYWLSIAAALGLFLLWMGERVVEAGSARMVLSGLGVVLVLGAVLLRFWRTSALAQRPDVVRIERTLLWLGAFALVGLFLYFAQSDVYSWLTKEALETKSPKLAALCSVFWPVALSAFVLPTLLVELSYAGMVRAPKMETLRIQEATFGGLGLVCVLTFGFAMQYVTTNRDVRKDYSYFRMARPGDATKRLAQSLTEELTVSFFYPPGNDVAAMVENYFDELKTNAPNLKIQKLDLALDPAKAKALSVNGNGVVVLSQAARKEQLFLGTDMEKAKTQLRGLDLEVQKRLLQVAKSKRTVYLTQGHGERTQDPIGGADLRATIATLYRKLQEQNFEVRGLSVAEGLANAVPKDAAAVFVVGPQTAFSAPEAQALEAYAKRGGRLFIALDPEPGLTFEELMKPLGLKFSGKAMANTESFARAAENFSPSDRANLVTKNFSSHPVVNYLNRTNAVLVTLKAGALEELNQHPAELLVDFPARTPAETWVDANGNYENEKEEEKKAFGLMAVVTRRPPNGGKPEEETRVMVIGDSDVLVDGLLEMVPGNQMLLFDGVKWLLGEEQLSGTMNSEVDVPLARDRRQDSFWFYGTTIVAPLMVLGVGLLMRRRTRVAVRRQPKAEVRA